jgi:hypothetical protein
MQTGFELVKSIPFASWARFYFKKVERHLAPKLYLVGENQIMVDHAS